MRIRTQQDFIAKAIEIHHGYYDYSDVVYERSNKKVIIICPIHGKFEQTPNSHLAGKGCKLCGQNRIRIGTDEFIRQAKNVHGDRYDYSKVDYQRTDKKVIIICPIHGEFEQTPHSHVTLKQNCPKCSAIEGGKKRSGNNNAMKKNTVKDKARKTNLKKYGANTWAESEEGRKKLHDIVTSEEVSQKMIATCRQRYGANTWSQSDEGHQKLHEIMSDKNMQQKIKDGYFAAYGINHYMKTDEGREKVRQAMYRPDIQKRIHSGEYNSAAWETKLKNETYTSSKRETTMFILLKNIFGEDNVLREYKDSRYPFHCDFYIKSLDLFIELNIHWVHGGHFYDPMNPLDAKQLSTWLSRAKEQKSQYYYNAIKIWTERDPLKLKFAINNNLNYLVFWRSDLSDVREWLESF